MLRNDIGKTLNRAIFQEASEQGVQIPENFTARIEYPPEFRFGHYSSPAPMELARVFRKNPRQIAEALKTQIDNVENSGLIEAVSVEGPGFLNFKLKPEALHTVFNNGFSVSEHIKEQLPPKTGKNDPVILFEFVSANPTGPLNIVSARAAAVGDTICRVLKAAGLNVYSEYYVNDYGNQVKLLAQSFAWRYLQQRGYAVELPEDAYQGEYIKDILVTILDKHHLHDKLADLPPHDNPEAIDQYISKAAEIFERLAIEALLETQKEDLKHFNVFFDRFFSEASLHESGLVEKSFEQLKELGALYKKDDAWFFKSTEYGDDKDRVVYRADGRPTYLMADIAYHAEKIARNFTHIYNIWGPDHHGYIARLSGAMQALGFGKSENEKFQVLIVQQVNMLEDGKPVVMSKRLGQFQTMKDLLEKIPVDVSRYFFINRAQSTHLDFDLELALNTGTQNPVYYIQYAHARIHSIFREAQIDMYSLEQPALEQLPGFLEQSERFELLLHLNKLPELLEDISANLEMQRLAAYAHETARLFTTFYHEKGNRIVAALENDRPLAMLLLYLSRATAQTLQFCLDLMGISAPTKM